MVRSHFPISPLTFENVFKFDTKSFCLNSFKFDTHFPISPCHIFFNFAIGDEGTREEDVVVGEGSEDDAILVV